MIFFPHSKIDFDYLLYSFAFLSEENFFVILSTATQKRIIKANHKKRIPHSVVQWLFYTSRKVYWYNSGPLVAVIEACEHQWDT